jgi:hypothetical protein
LRGSLKFTPLVAITRRRFDRAVKGQIGAARLFRGYRARKKRNLRIYRRNQCAKCIQDGWWRWLENKLEARVRLQCFFRFHMARWHVEERRR